MHYLEVIKVLKYFFSGMAIVLIAYRWMRIIGFNNGGVESVPFRIFSYYNRFEVDGTDVPSRRYFMRKMNRVLGFTITCIALAVLTQVLPRILAFFGL